MGFLLDVDVVRVIPEARASYPSPGCAAAKTNVRPLLMASQQQEQQVKRSERSVEPDVPDWPMPRGFRCVPKTGFQAPCVVYLDRSADCTTNRAQSAFDTLTTRGCLVCPGCQARATWLTESRGPFRAACVSMCTRKGRSDRASHRTPNPNDPRLVRAIHQKRLTISIWPTSSNQKALGASFRVTQDAPNLRSRAFPVIACHATSPVAADVNKAPKTFM